MPELSRFFRSYPDARIVVAVILLYPLFAAVLPSKASTSSVVWFIVLLVGSIALLRTMRSMFNHDVGPRFGRFLARTIALAVLAPVIALSAAIAWALLFPDKSSGPIGRMADILLGAEPTEVKRDPPQVATAQQAPLPSAPSPPTPKGSSAFSECLSKAYKAQDQKAIVNCTEHLPK